MCDRKEGRKNENCNTPSLSTEGFHFALLDDFTSLKLLYLSVKEILNHSYTGLVQTTTNLAI